MNIEFTSNNQFILNIATVDNPRKTERYMLDTGAYNNIIRLETVMNMKSRNIDYTDKVLVTGFNLTQEETLGSIKIGLLIGNSCYMVRFFIVKDLCVPAIIGAQFLKQYTIYISEQFSSIILRKPYEDDNYVYNKGLNQKSTWTEINNKSKICKECNTERQHEEARKSECLNDKNTLFKEIACQTDRKSVV